MVQMIPKWGSRQKGASKQNKAKKETRDDRKQIIKW